MFFEDSYGAGHRPRKHKTIVFLSARLFFVALPRSCLPATIITARRSLRYAATFLLACWNIRISWCTPGVLWALKKHVFVTRRSFSRVLCLPSGFFIVRQRVCALSLCFSAPNAAVPSAFVIRTKTVKNTKDQKEARRTTGGTPQKYKKIYIGTWASCLLLWGNYHKKTLIFMVGAWDICVLLPGKSEDSALSFFFETSENKTEENVNPEIQS